MIGYKATASPLSPVDEPVLKPAQKKTWMVAINPKIMG